MESYMYQSPKSSTTAGLLGIFLGVAGGHNWYLGQKQKGIIHCVLLGVGVALLIAAQIYINIKTSEATSSLYGALNVLAGAGTTTMIYNILWYVGWAAIAGSEVWGATEGITILTKGDAYLASLGYPVQNPMGQPMNNGYNNMPNQMSGMPMGQPYPQQPMNGGMPMGQPYPQQPMSGGMPNQMGGMPMDNTINNQPVNTPENPIQQNPFEQNTNQGDNNGQQ